MGQAGSKPFEGKVIQSLTGHNREVLHCQFNNAGDILATCSGDTTVILWTVATGEPLRTLKGHASEVTCCSFYDNILATASTDKTVILWLYGSGKRASKLAIHSGPVWACAISPNGQLLATVSQDKTARLVKFRPGSGAFVSGSEMLKLVGHRASVNDVQFAPNETYVATASEDKTIRLWDSENGTCAMCLDDPFGGVLKLRFAPQGDYMISLSAPGSFVSVWNMEKHIVDNVLETNNGREIQNIALSPDGRLTIGLSEDNRITLWEKMTRKCPPELRTTRHKRGINTIAISSNNDCWVATGDGEGNVFLWN